MSRTYKVIPGYRGRSLWWFGRNEDHPRRTYCNGLEGESDRWYKTFYHRQCRNIVRANVYAERWDEARWDPPFDSYSSSKEYRFAYYSPDKRWLMRRHGRFHTIWPKVARRGATMNVNELTAEQRRIVACVRCEVIATESHIAVELRRSGDDIEPELEELVRRGWLKRSKQDNRFYELPWRVLWKTRGWPS